MRVTLSAKARRDLESIGDYIARDDPRAAITFIAEPREKCDGLSHMPRRFPRIPRYAKLGIRKRVHDHRRSKVEAERLRAL